MRYLNWIWSWAPDAAGPRRFATIVRGVVILAFALGIIVPDLRTAIFAWVVAQEAARIEPTIQHLLDVVATTGPPPGK